MPANLRFAARRDANEGAIVDALERLGGKWLPTGVLDGWAGYAGVWCPVEIKLPHREGHADEFTDVQRKFMAERAADGLPYQVWRSEDDVVSWVNGLRVAR